jgi:hypothetical protein
MRFISIVRSSYFRIFSASFVITFLSPEIAVYCYYYYWTTYPCLITITPTLKTNNLFCSDLNC